MIYDFDCLFVSPTLSQEKAANGDNAEDDDEAAAAAVADELGLGSDDEVWRRYFLAPLESAGRRVIWTEKANGEAAHVAVTNVAGVNFVVLGSKVMYQIFANFILLSFSFTCFELKYISLMIHCTVCSFHFLGPRFSRHFSVISNISSSLFSPPECAHCTACRLAVFRSGRLPAARASRSIQDRLHHCGGSDCLSARPARWVLMMMYKLIFQYCNFFLFIYLSVSTSLNRFRFPYQNPF